MRTIKFRGKIEGQWWYATPEDNAWEQFWALVKRETVGEWTGLTDLANTEIYDGDVLAVHALYSKHTGRVYWGVNTLPISDWGHCETWMLHFTDLPENRDAPLYPYCRSHGIAYELRVIGNVHDTPELAPDKVGE